LLVRKANYELEGPPFMGGAELTMSRVSCGGERGF